MCVPKLRWLSWERAAGKQRVGSRISVTPRVDSVEFARRKASEHPASRARPLGQATNPSSRHAMLEEGTRDDGTPRTDALGNTNERAGQDVSAAKRGRVDASAPRDPPSVAPARRSNPSPCRPCHTGRPFRRTRSWPPPPARQPAAQPSSSCLVSRGQTRVTGVVELFFQFFSA